MSAYSIVFSWPVSRLYVGQKAAANVHFVCMFKFLKLITKRNGLSCILNSFNNTTLGFASLSVTISRHATRVIVQHVWLRTLGSRHGQ